MQRFKHRPSGFTIVELLIVIIVIAILAVITTVVYNGVQKAALASMVQDTLKKTSAAMEAAAIEHEAPFNAIPSSVQVADGVGVALATVGDATTYCINGTTTRNTSVAYHLQRGQAPAEGLCEGEVIASTITGDYAAGTISHTPDSARVELASPQGNFRLDTGEAWTEFILSWDAVEGATRYEVQTRDGEEGTWCYHAATNGAYCNASKTGGDSSSISASTTSLNWTSSTIKPSSAAVTHYYRWRSVTASATSDWQTIALTPKPATELTKVGHPTVTPRNSWQQIVLAWDAVVGNSSVPSPRVEIQTKDGDNGTWCYHAATNGAYCNASKTGGDSSSISASITSLNWTSSTIKPSSAAVTHYYRFRLNSAIISGMASDWVVVPLNNVTTAQMNKITHFTVTPNNDWSSVQFNWNISATDDVPSPRVEIQTKDGDNGTWCYHAATNGAYCNASKTGGDSSSISASITSLNWTSSTIKPSSAAVTHYYRIRLATSMIAGVVSDWQTVSITPPATDSIAAVQGFTVTPSSDWASVTLSWHAYMPVNVASPTLEVQTRVAGGTWCYHAATNGAYCNASITGGDSSSISASTTSLAWTSSTSKPATGTAHEYRIRVRSNAAPTGVYGPWATYTLTRP